MAYLTSKDQAVNTFTVGKVHIELDEAKVNEDGKKLNTDNKVYEEEGGTLADRVTANTYKLIPGRTYTKDPTVWVKVDSEPSYIRMIVTISHYTELRKIFGNDFLPQYFVDWNENTWKSTKTVNVDTENDTASYEFRYHNGTDGVYTVPENVEIHTVANADGEYAKLPPLFEKIEFPGEWIDNEELEKLQDMTITVAAHAVQAAGFEGNEDAAWTAFDGQQRMNENKNK